MKKLFFPLIYLAIVTSVGAQSKKQLAKQNIRSRIAWEIDYENTKDKEFKESDRIFDENGEIIEEIEYDEAGRITSHKKFEYNEDGKTIKEISISPKGKIKNYIEYEYNGKRLINEVFYDSKGNIKKTAKYKYEGDLKIEKAQYDSNGKLIYKRRYEYFKRD